MKRTWGLGLALAGLALAPSAASASGSFAGNCSIADGRVAFDRGVTGQTQENKGNFTAPLRCGGEVNGRGDSSVAGRLVASFAGPVGCTGTTRPSEGRGTLEVGGASIPGSFSLTVSGLNLSYSFTPGGSGKATGSGTFGAAANANEMMRCASSGLKVATFDGDLRGKVADETPRASAPTVTAPRLAFDRSQRAGTVLRRGGVRVRCIVSAAGPCRVRVLRGRTLLATGRGSARAGGSVTVFARLTPAGRRALRRSVRAVVRVTSSGKSRSRRIAFRR